MKKKIRVAIQFGGRSAEHEVSLQSAKSIIEAIDATKYEIVLIGIDKEGRWLLNNQNNYLHNATNPKLIKLNKSLDELAIRPGNKDKQLVSMTRVPVSNVDVVFPVLHGTLGEDGTMQGLLRLMDMAFVGADVLGSAIGMDKDVMKRLLRDAEIPIGKFITLKKGVLLTFEEAKKSVGIPLFIKPANQGSSVGVHKVQNEKEYLKAIEDAFLYDRKIIIEQFIDGREIECSVLGNHDPIASVPGEVIPQHEFYSYEAKYIDEDGAKLEIPARLSKKLITEIQKIAINTFQTLSCEGMARVDCFLTKENKIYVNEINTIPGFTKISMYPKLWEASGISYPQLIDRLIQLALERHEEQKKLKTTF